MGHEIRPLPLIISNEDIINLVLDPFTHLDAHRHREEASLCSLHMAFTFTAKNTAYSGRFLEFEELVCA